MSKPPPPPRRDSKPAKPSTPTLAPTSTTEPRRPSIPDSVLSLVDREAEAERKRNARLAATESVPRQVECYENERYYPFAGWSKKLFPTERPQWSNEEGTMIQGFTDFNVPSDWHWTTDWTIQRVDGGDPDGWMYAIDFGLKWKPTYSFGHCVRRRRWTRKRAPTNEESELALKKLEMARKSTKPGRSTPPTSSAAASLLSLYDDDTTSLQQKETETSRCIEYQRYYPVAGWSSKLLPTDKFTWSDVDGIKSTPPKDEWKVTPPWKWSSDWTIESDGDQDGWTYATDFTSSTWSDKKGFSDFVRKRIWTRDKEKPLDPSRPGSSSSNKSYDQFFHRLEAFKQDLKAEEEDDDVVALSSATY